MPLNCSLSSLYKGQTHQIVYARLAVYFEQIFDKVLSEAAKQSPHLVSPARYFEDRIKDYFIEDGLKLENIEDLDSVLKKLNYLDIQHFKKAKKDFEKKDGIVKRSVRSDGRSRIF